MTSTQQRQIRVGRGPEALQRLRDEWCDLWKQGPQADFVTSHAWYSAYLETLEDNPDDFLMLSFHLNGRCVGILPLLQGNPRPALFRPTLLEIPRLTGMDISRIVLAPHQKLREWWPLVRQTLGTAGIPFFVIKTSNVPLDSASAQQLDGMEPCLITRVQAHSCWFDCDQPVEEIRQCYRSRLKKILRKGYKGLGREGDITFRTISNSEGLASAYQIFLQLEASGWKGAQGSATALALAPQARKFHESFLFGKNADVSPQINLLYCGDRAVAAQLCICHGKTISLLKIAFDQSLARFSPGSILLDQLIDHCCRNSGCKKVSLITGQPWMDNWSPGKTPLADIWMFDRPAVAAVVRLLLQLRSTLHSAKERIQRRMK